MIKYPPKTENGAGFSFINNPIKQNKVYDEQGEEPRHRVFYYRQSDGAFIEDTKNGRAFIPIPKLRRR